eukprot:1770387-Rhodomonas_salina.2
MFGTDSAVALRICYAESGTQMQNVALRQEKMFEYMVCFLWHNERFFSRATGKSRFLAPQSQQGQSIRVADSPGNQSRNPPFWYCWFPEILFFILGRMG